jgi:hypothetical protein
LCTAPTHIHLLSMSSPVSVCCICVHPHRSVALHTHQYPTVFYVSSHFSPTYSFISLIVNSSYCSVSILKSCLWDGFMFSSLFLNTPPILHLFCHNVFTVPSICIQKSEVICSETEKPLNG